MSRIRNVKDSKNLCIGQYDKFFEEYCLLPILELSPYRLTLILSRYLIYLLLRSGGSKKRKRCTRFFFKNTHKNAKKMHTIFFSLLQQTKYRKNYKNAHKMCKNHTKKCKKKFCISVLTDILPSLSPIGYPREPAFTILGLGISGPEAFVRHAAFWKVSPRHMVEMARETRFPEDRIRGCYVEQEGQGW